MKKKLLLGVALVACGAMVLAGCDDPVDTTTSTSIDSGSTSSSPTLDVPLAEGVYNFQGADPTQKAELVAKMEQYAVDHHLAGIPLYDDAGYEMYSPRITLGSNTYIPNYGFGLLDGSLNTTGNMYNGSTAQANGLAYPDYFHSYNNLDSGTFNYWDSDGEDVSGRYGMVATSLFSVKMNDTNDGYVWRGELSKTDRPIMLDENGNEVEYHEGDTSRFWRVKVFTSEDENTIKLSTKSTTIEVFNLKTTSLRIKPFSITASGGPVKWSPKLTASTALRLTSTAPKRIGQKSVFKSMKKKVLSTTPSSLRRPNSTRCITSVVLFIPQFQKNS